MLHTGEEINLTCCPQDFRLVDLSGKDMNRTNLVPGLMVELKFDVSSYWTKIRAIS